MDFLGDARVGHRPGGSGRTSGRGVEGANPKDEANATAPAPSKPGNLRTRDVRARRTLATLSGGTRSSLCTGARHRTRAARLVLIPRTWSRPRGDRRAWRRVAERPRRSPPHKHGFIVSDNALRHGNHFAHEFLGFFEVLEITKGIRAIAGCLEGEPMFSAIKPQYPEYTSFRRRRASSCCYNRRVSQDCPSR